MEKLQKLTELVEKELRAVEEKGLTTANLESTYKLVDILKDIKEIESEQKEMMGGQYQMPYMPYMEGGSGRGYDRYDGYMPRPYGNDGYSRPYMEGGDHRQNGRGGNQYGGYDPRMREHLNRIYEGAEMYEYGRDRYQHGDSEQRVTDGLEKMMYAICSFIQSTMEFAQTPQEKEIIRNHMQKLRNI